jgi:hypothetical protein
MTYIEELSEYTYAHSAYYRPITKAVGWLARDHTFWSFQPTDELLDLIWQYCKFPVARMRGSHDCEFCSTNLSTARDLPSLLAGLKEARHHRRVERNGETMMLGSAEMRVFGKNGLVYAAPNLITTMYLFITTSLPPNFLKPSGVILGRPTPATAVC